MKDNSEESFPLAHESLMQSIFENSPDCIKILSADAKLLYMNSSGQKITEIDDFNLIKGADWLSMWQGEAYQEAVKAFEKAGKEGFGHFTAQGHTAKGTPKWWDITISPVYDQQRNITHIIAVTRDITAQKKTEAALKESEERFRYMSDTSPLYIWMTDQKGDLIYYNKSLKDFLGYTDEDVTTKGWGPIVHPDDLENTSKQYLDAIEARKPYEGEFRTRRYDGEYFWMLSKGVPRYNENGEYLGYIGSGFDIHERKIVAEAQSQKAQILEGIADGFLSFDKNWNFTYVNHEGAKTLGRTPEELNGKNLWQEFPALENSSFGKLYKQAMQDGQTKTYEDYYAPFNSWFAVRVYPSDAGLSLFFQNISDRKQAELELQKQNIFIKTVTDNATKALFMMDDRQHCTFMNPAAEKMTGYKFSEVQEKPLHYYIHHTYPDGRPFPMDECEIDRALPEKAQTRGEEVFVHRDGHFYPVSFTASPIIENGKPVATVIEVRDISEEKRAQENLKNSEETLRLATESTNIGTWDFNLITNELKWSEVCKKLFGLDKDEFIDYGTFLTCLYPEDRQRVDMLVQEAIKGKTFDAEFRIVMKDSTERWIRSTGETFFNEAGIAARFIGIAEDITGNKKYEQAMLKRSEQLAAANDELRDFAYVISHDLKTPLRSISYLSDILIEDSSHLNEDEQKKLSRIKDNAVKMYNMIQSILIYSETGRENVIKEKIDLNTLVNEVKEMVNPPENVTVTVIKPLPQLFINKTRIYQLFQNLIVNAVKHLDKPTGIITVDVEEKEDNWQFSVSDNGVGIEEKHFNKIFRIFYTISGSKETTGIGLSIVKKIVQGEGGKIWLESKPGLGTTFYFTIPK